jgi:hypothetical protein
VSIRPKKSEILGAFLAAMVSAINGGVTPAADVMRFAYNVPGDAKPIVLHADSMASWVDGTRRVILAKGQVLIEHGGMQVRSDQAVAWIDQQEHRRTGVLRCELYLEGQVALESGADRRSAPSALVDVYTRGEIKLKAYVNKVVQQPQPNDSLYQEAQAVRLTQPNAPPAAPVQQAALRPATTRLPQTSGYQPLAQPLLPNGPSVPASQGSGPNSAYR